MGNGATRVRHVLHRLVLASTRVVTVSWRPSVAEVVWKGAPAPAFLRLYTTHTRNTHPLPGDGNLYCVHSIANNWICKTTGDH